ncbi:MAG TPA: hypothetical protein DCM08_00840 [Microscillaceae bacterium]|jgi:SAM-dependent methyltransferase|nr:hypothetical protein [Microscillaceae bacterium]
MKQLISSSLLAMLALLLVQCREADNRSSAKGEDALKAFFNTVNLLADEEGLKDYLVKNKLDKMAVYEQLRKIDDPLMRARFIKAVYLTAKNNNQKAAKDEFWADIRYDIYDFMRLMQKLRESNSKTFLDIGCGSGQKLYAALCMGFEKVVGIEYSEESYGYAIDFLAPFIKNNLVEITKGDALKIEDEFYSKADFLYTYSPMKDDKLMAQLFQRVMKNMKNGAIFLEVRMVYVDELRELTGYKVPYERGFFAIKKIDGEFFFKNPVYDDDWEKLPKLK